MPVLTRSEFESFLRSADLSDRAVRQQVNSTVIEEVADTRYKVRHWSVAGCAPLSTSGDQYLRPCPHVVFGARGWHVVFENQWFCN